MDKNLILSDLTALRDLREGLVNSVIDSDPGAYLLMFKYEENPELQELLSKLYIIDWITNYIEEIKKTHDHFEFVHILKWLLQISSGLTDSAIKMQDAVLIGMVDGYEAICREYLRTAISQKKTLKEVEYFLARESRLFHRELEKYERII